MIEHNVLETPWMQLAATSHRNLAKKINKSGGNNQDGARPELQQAVEIKYNQWGKKHKSGSCKSAINKV